MGRGQGKGTGTDSGTDLGMCRGGVASESEFALSDLALQVEAGDQESYQ